MNATAALKLAARTVIAGMLFAVAKAGLASGPGEGANRWKVELPPAVPGRAPADTGVGLRLLRTGAGARASAWGVALRRSLADGRRRGDTFVFRERRDGRLRSIVGLSCVNGGDWLRPALGGRHVWFTNAGLGLGVSWHLGRAGEGAAGAADGRGASVVRVGAMLVFRAGH